MVRTCLVFILHICKILNLFDCFGCFSLVKVLVNSFLLVYFKVITFVCVFVFFVTQTCIVKIIKKDLRIAFHILIIFNVHATAVDLILANVDLRYTLLHLVFVLSINVLLDPLFQGRFFLVLVADHI